MLLTFDLRNLVDQVIQSFDVSPWRAHACGCHAVTTRTTTPRTETRLYSDEERRRRDASHWTLVQGILAPLQFAVFLVSLGLVLHYMATGEGLAIATASVVVKTAILYLIMVTGSLWERDVFGRYLFAPAFFWEDVVSIFVLALHTAYLAAVVTGTLGTQEQMVLVLLAYAAYVVNATQFVLKLRMARKEPRADRPADTARA